MNIVHATAMAARGGGAGQSGAERRKVATRGGAEQYREKQNRATRKSGEERNDGAVLYRLTDKTINITNC